MDDESYSRTVDVTIEIDDDVAQGISAKEVSTRRQGPWIRPPLRIEDVRLRSACSFSVGELSNEAITLLSSHLSIPSYGSLKNWDSIGIHLGIPDHEVMSLRQDPKPMEAILKKCWTSPAKDVISALQFFNRIDLLYSLRKLEQKGKLRRASEKVPSFTSASTSFASPFVTSSLGTDSAKVILLIHYEEDSNETRDVKWLRKNLVQHASRFNFRVVDIADLDFDANLTSVVEEAFSKAYQIVVSFTPSHIEAVKSRSTACRAVIYAHDLMNQEFFTHNSINRRFRAVIFNDTQQSDLPVGWPRSTLVYHFPTNMATLCAKLFKNNDLDGMVTT